MSDTSEQRHPPEVLLNEAASLLYLLGGLGTKHLVLIGGLVPPLLAPSAAEPHIGSSDIDLLLSVAITEGATAQYYRSLEKTLRSYFEPVPGSSFRWKKLDLAPGVPLVVDFLGPELAQAQLLEDGTHEVSDEIAAENLGPTLRPLPLSAGKLMELDAIEHEVEVDLVYGQPGDQATLRYRHTGPAGFLAAKAAALDGRVEDKDGYDVAWWCLNVERDPQAVIELVTAREAFHDRLFPESLSVLRSAFAKPSYPGPAGYARESEPDAQPGSDEHEQARNRAHLVVTEVVEGLIASIDWDRHYGG